MAPRPRTDDSFWVRILDRWATREGVFTTLFVILAGGMAYAAYQSWMAKIEIERNQSRTQGLLADAIIEMKASVTEIGRGVKTNGEVLAWAKEHMKDAPVWHDSERTQREAMVKQLTRQTDMLEEWLKQVSPKNHETPPKPNG